jgi:hypothetical protein
LSGDNTGLTTSVLDPPDTVDVVIEGSDNLELTWNAVSDATGYHVYRDTTAYFTPDKTGGTNRIATGITDEDPGTSGVQWTDTDDVIGDPATHYFYAVTSIDGTNESDISTRIGEFDYELLANASTYYYNMITYLFDIGLTTAAELGENISSDGSYCYRIYKYNSSAGVLDLIAKYSAGQWLNVGDVSNYTIAVGDAYLIKMNLIGTNLTWTMVGEVPNDPAFTLDSSDETYLYHTISLPLEHGSDNNIDEASELGADISSDGSTCYRIYRYNATAGVLDLIAKYSAGMWLNVGDVNNYSIRVGYPYYIKMQLIDGIQTWP